MEEWIETKVVFDRTMSNGFNKRVTEQYLINAFSFTEAETNINKEMQAYISGEFEVAAVKKSNISEIVYGNGDRWYKAKLMFITINEKNDEEKKTAQHILVRAGSFEEALDNLIDHMKDSVADYEIACIAETKFLDVFDKKLS